MRTTRFPVLLVAILGMVLSVRVNAQPASERSAAERHDVAPANDVASAHAGLESVHLFAFGGIGIAGMTSPGETAFDEIARRSNAASEFKTVFEHGTPEAKCYALIALRELDPQAFRACVATWPSHPPPQIRTMNGCLVGSISADKLVTAIAAGKFAGRLPSKPRR